MVKMAMDIRKGAISTYLEATSWFLLGFQISQAKVTKHAIFSHIQTCYPSFLLHQTTSCRSFLGWNVCIVGSRQKLGARYKGVLQ